MAYVTGLLIIDAPAAALNNAGVEPGAKTDNVIVVKKIRTPRGVYPYVSAQAFRYWLRKTLEASVSDWVAAPVFREAKIAYTDANPITNWDDDLFGYMRAPSRRTDATRAANATPLEAGREVTRVSPFRVSTVVAIGPSPIIDDFGTMARQDGDPVPHEHEFYRAHLLALFSLDLTCAGTFFDSERVGFKNLDSHRREQAQKEGLEDTMVRGQKAFRLSHQERQRRVVALIQALANLDGGAKLTLHYTDVTPAVLIAAVARNGNHPFTRWFSPSKTNETQLHLEAVAQSLEVYGPDILSPISIGWAQGFLDDERVKLPAHERIAPPRHPRQAIEALVAALKEPSNRAWYD
jgi:CRISPR-associated protein Cst2